MCLNSYYPMSPQIHLSVCLPPHLFRNSLSGCTWPWCCSIPATGHLCATPANKIFQGLWIQELSYRKQIARQLHRQCVDGIYRPKYYTITLKSRLRVTQAHWKWTHWIDHTWLTNLLLVELFDVEYYRDLEMWVRGHSRSLKVVPFESLGTVS